MKPFECGVCGLKASSKDVVVRWRFNREKGSCDNFSITHGFGPCSETGEGEFYNRRLEMDYVYKYMPEFIYYINRHDVNEKKFRDFIHSIEKGRSYIKLSARLRILDNAGSGVLRLFQR